MMERVELIPTECYIPLPKDRPFKANFRLGRLTADFFGTNAIVLCRRMASGESFSREATEEINEYFYKANTRIYNLPDWTHPRSFYKKGKEDAIAAIRYFGDLVPELAEAFELREEIAHLSDRPSDLLRYLASPTGEIHPTLAYEAQRHAIAQCQLGMVEVRTLNADLINLLADIQDLLNEKLFKGPKGNGEDFCTESYHDDETNEVVGFPDRNRRPFTAHLKRRWISVRQIPEIGFVHEKSREKGPGPTYVKLLVKALENGGIVNLNDAVQDSIGMKIVLMDDGVPPEQLADLVVSVIREGIEFCKESNHPNQIPDIDKIENDNETDKDHGQSTEINFNARRKIWFKGVPTPIELQFSSRETYLNAEYEVGTRDLETGLYKGRGHKLFELRRPMKEGKQGIKVIRVLFPQKVYKKIDDDRLYRAFVNQSKQIAYGYRNMYKAA